jgi:hypothetical protein
MSTLIRYLENTQGSQDRSDKNRDSVILVRGKDYNQNRQESTNPGSDELGIPLEVHFWFPFWWSLLKAESKTG